MIQMEIKFIYKILNYNIKNNIFKSVGLTKIKDKLKNIYEFNQIYIDTKKKKFWVQI